MKQLAAFDCTAASCRCIINWIYEKYRISRDTKSQLTTSRLLHKLSELLGIVNISHTWLLCKHYRTEQSMNDRVYMYTRFTLYIRNYTLRLGTIYIRPTTLPQNTVHTFIFTFSSFRRLNEVTVTDAFPLPNLTHLLATIQAAPVYSTMDLCSGYLQASNEMWISILVTLVEAISEVSL